MAMKRGIEKAITAICGAFDPKTGERAKGELDKLSNPVTGDMIAQGHGGSSGFGRPAGWGGRPPYRAAFALR